MSMTRKDYILLAETLKSARDKELGSYRTVSEYIEQHPDFGTPENIYRNKIVYGVAELAHNFVALELANALGADNPRFETERFMQAAGAR